MSSRCAWSVSVKVLDQAQFSLPTSVPSTSSGVSFLSVAIGFALGVAATFLFHYLWAQFYSWHSKRVERLLNRLETLSSSLIREKRYSECISELKLGLDYLTNSGVPRQSTDVTAVRHLLAKVLLLDQQPRSAELILDDVCLQYQSAGVEDLLHAETLEDLGRAIAAQSGREKEAIVVWQRCIEMHSACNSLERLSMVIQRLDDFSLSPVAPANRKLLYSPGQESLQSSATINRIRALMDEVEERSASPTSVAKEI